MNDRELLELAAKAAGLKHVDYTGIDYDGRLGIVLVDDIGRHCGEFSPLTDDGDALRLAVKLQLEIERSLYREGIVYVGRVGDAKWMEESDEKQDILESTRRAIVRAAAEIGKTMK